MEGLFKLLFIAAAVTAIMGMTQQEAETFCNDKHGAVLTKAKDGCFKENWPQWETCSGSCDGRDDAWGPGATADIIDSSPYNQCMEECLQDAGVSKRG